MRNNYVAVLDIRSSEMTAVVGERGVNNTFIIKNKYTCEYDGYAEGAFLDVEGFIDALSGLVRSTLSSSSGIKSFYVGVPGEFLNHVVVDKVVSFQSAKKITAADCKTLGAAAKPADNGQWWTIKHSCLYYTLSDKRKIIDPVGTVSDSLQGKFCFYKCSTGFKNCITKAFRRFGDIATVNLIPSTYAQAMYLFESEKRDEYAVLFDLGYISSTYSVICGNGVLYSESFSVGIGHIAMYLMTELDIPFEVATRFLSTVNLNAKDRLSSVEECVYKGETYRFPTAELCEKIRVGLDGICETIEECRQNFTGRNLDSKPLYITGECVKTIRGTVEHIAGRLVKVVETVAPKVPYYDKPQFSSFLSLLDAALRDAKS